MLHRCSSATEHLLAIENTYGTRPCTVLPGWELERSLNNSVILKNMTNVSSMFVSSRGIYQQNTVMRSARSRNRIVRYVQCLSTLLNKSCMFSVYMCRTVSSLHKASTPNSGYIDHVCQAKIIHISEKSIKQKAI